MSRALSLLFPAGCLCFAILLGLPGAVYAPDASYYRLLALAQRHAVPAPFSARILGPAIAGLLGRMSGLGVDTGFFILGVACLVALLALLTGLLWSWRAPAVIFAAIFLMPFWVDLFHDYYLPDLLHATILAALLLSLLFGHSGLALLLLFPAYLARESSLLVALCLVFACWRRIPWRSALMGVGALACAVFVSKHYSQGGPVSAHGISGGTYILGKLLWSFPKNLLGVPLWSNTLPECTPIWVVALPHSLHPGAIQAVGICQPALWGPARTLLAWFGAFGIAPALVFALRKRMLAPPNGHRLDASPGTAMVLRFSLLYGIISIVMAPLLGASADRLVAYGWPLYFVALPWFMFQQYRLQAARSATMLALHLFACWLAWFGFRQQPSLVFSAGLVVLALNGLSYLLVTRSCRLA